MKTYLGHGHEVFDVGVSSDNIRLASCGGDKNVFYWDVASGQIIRKFRGHDLKVNAVLFRRGLGCGYLRLLRQDRAHLRLPLPLLRRHAGSHSFCL